MKYLEPRNDITFRCDACRHVWDSEPDDVVEDSNLSHPYRYFADCPECGDRAQQIPWQRGLFSSYVKSTGPRTLEGKAASAANLDGHPTPEEAMRTRFNALKHGAAAKQALYFPARPGQYEACKTCDIDFDYCATQVACTRRTELFMRHLIAIESNDPRVLREHHAITQANLATLMDDMLLSVISKGVLLETPAYAFDKDGGFHLAEYTDSNTGEKKKIMDAKANPLLKHIFDLMSKNNLSLSDMGMTQRVQEENEIQMGRLQQDEKQKSSLLEFQQSQAQSLDKLQEMLKNSQKELENDPILIEHKQANGDG
ncbi:hypothetical protein [Alteromonas sp. C1M14]|uniref:hypothetical protein n=1 Tax=Alteromonas sp. C1M14 TaxID=2841567 RepID=UPI001C0A19A7|nr:hypothetical protein [Alteromonas sp. C1M14]MBU2979018.1 hypothetical protein [Alteromonas sp. C1M14]